MPIDVMSDKPNKDAIIAVVGGILCRNCSERVNMVQHIFSVLFMPVIYLKRYAY